MDDLREFEELLKRVGEASANIADIDHHGAALGNIFFNGLSAAMKEWRKRHQHENSHSSVDFGEPLPTMLDKQVDFGEE